MRHSMRALGRAIAIMAALLGVAGLVTGCGSSTDKSTTSGTKTIQVDFSGSNVTPNGDTVTVSRGQEVKLEVTADKAGEIHVHTQPAKEYQYGVGTTSISLGKMEVPGQFEVESHALGKTIVILQVK